MHDTITRSELLRSGRSVQWIAAAVHRGALIRVRRGHYAQPTLDDATVRAVRVGGRLACVSELRYRGIWVLDDERIHVHVALNAARLRDPDDRTKRLEEQERRTACHVHWGALVAPERSSASHVSALDALLQAADCLTASALVASIDSALRLGQLAIHELARLAAALPVRLRSAVERIDALAESGLESIVRQLAVALGFHVESQVWFDEDIRTDLVLEGWIVVECDGDAWHDEKVTSRDRHRDGVLVQHGRTVLHFRYSQIVFDPAFVARTMIAAVRTHRRVRNSGEIADRAEKRARKLGFT